MMSSLLLPFPTIASGYIGAIWQLCALNVVRGFATSAALYTAYIYLSELTPPNMRSVSTSLFHSFTSLSYILVDVLAYYSGGWRMLSVYLGFLTLPLWLSFLVLPKSPRWLLSKGKHAEAQEILTKMVKRRIELSIPKRTGCRNNMKTYSYLDLVRSGDMLKMTLGLVCMWFVTPVLYYTISVEAMDYHGGTMYINYALAMLADLPAMFLTTFFSRTIGRKKTNVSGCIIASVLFACILLVPRSLTQRHAVLMTMTVVAKMLCDMAFVGMFLWTSELYPTVVRSKGMSAAF